MADRIQDYAVNSDRWLSLEDFDGEVWKDIPEYEGWYQVSSLGRVKSLGRYITDKTRPNRKLFFKERIIRQFQNSTKYYTLHLSKNSKIKIVATHRLVAKAFIPNPNNYKCINHKDESRTNNCVSNLEWCTHKYNTNYGTCIQRVIEGNLKRTDMAVPVYKYDLQGNYICKYPSCRAIYREMGISIRSIRQCLDGIHAASHGYIWLREKDDNKAKDMSNWYYNPKNAKRVIQMSLCGEIVSRFKSILEASIKTGISYSTISKCCNHTGYHRSAGGYRWEYA